MILNVCWEIFLTWYVLLHYLFPWILRPPQECQNRLCFLQVSMSLSLTLQQMKCQVMLHCESWNWQTKNYLKEYWKLSSVWNIDILPEILLHTCVLKKWRSLKKLRTPKTKTLTLNVGKNFRLYWNISSTNTWFSSCFYHQF